MFKKTMVRSLLSQVGLAVLLAICAGRASAQTFTTLLSFSGTNGSQPYGDLTLSGSTLYGTTTSGGANNDGTVFSIATSGGTPTTLLSFSGTNGYIPFGDLTLSGSTLYGTTTYGGANNYGTVFSLATSGGAPTTLLSFNGTNGANPYYGSLSVIGSTLYGMTYQGGTSNNGTVFNLATSGGAPTTLLAFSGTNGQNPTGSLTLSGSTLYGMTYNGGASNYGTVFSLATSGGASTTLLSFNGTNGANPRGSLTLSGSTLYGMTSANGANNDGTVFSIATSGGTPTTLLSFNGTNGSQPYGSLTLSGSTFYGITYRGGASNEGTVFSLATSGGAPTTLLSFSGTNGQLPDGSLILNGSTLYGTTQYGGANNVGTIFALNIAPATLALSGTGHATIVSSGTAAFGMTVSNSPSSGYNLNYTLGASVQNGGATLGTITPSTGSLAPGGSQACTVGATSTTFGITVLSFTASDPNSSNLSQANTASLTVLDHSNASLSSTAAQTTQTINFGNVLKGASIPGRTFTIYNQAANTSATYTASLKLTGLTASGDSALTTNLSPFNGLAAGSGTTGTASLNTSNYTTSGIKTVSITASQLADDSALSGAGSNNNGGMTITLEGNVGNATADKSNSLTSFGTPLTAAVARNASYANLESMATATTGSGGYDLVGSTATILAGTNSSSLAETVSMSWRTQTSSERTHPALISDVVNLSGMSLDGIGSQTSPFVLQMTYNPSLLPSGSGSEGLWASEGLIYLGWRNPNTNQWQNAIDGNFGTNTGTFHPGAWPNGDMTLGDWGVNTANDTVWAIINHNSDFAVVPEPSTLILLCVFTLGLLGYGWRQRQLESQSPAVDEDDPPSTLAFSSRSTYVMRQAA